MQHRVDDFKRRNALDRVNAARNAASVVLDRNTAVCMDLHRDLVAHAGKCLVDGVVHNLIDEMVKSLLRGRTDVHTRAFANGFQPFEHLNLTVFVCAVILFHVVFLSGEWLYRKYNNNREFWRWIKVSAYLWLPQRGRLDGGSKPPPYRICDYLKLFQKSLFKRFCRARGLFEKAPLCPFLSAFTSRFFLRGCRGRGWTTARCRPYMRRPSHRG